MSADEPSTSYLRLKAGLQLDKKPRFIMQQKNTLLDHHTFQIIVLDDHILLQDLDRVQFILLSLLFGQHDLHEYPRRNRTPRDPPTYFAERTLAEYFDEIEIRFFHRIRVRRGA